MLDIHFDERGELAIDNLEDLYKAFPKYAKRAGASALSSEGFRLNNEIQRHMRHGFYLLGWPPLHPGTGVIRRHRKAIRRRAAGGSGAKNWKSVWRGKKGRRRRGRSYWYESRATRSRTGGGVATAPMLKLAGAARYKVDKDFQQLNVGFLPDMRSGSFKMIRLIEKQARGYTTTVTEDMRKMFFAMGVPLKKSTTTLKTPRRPVISTVFRQERGNIHKNLVKKFKSAVLRYSLQGAASMKRAA